jgi:hypothetical protein
VEQIVAELLAKAAEIGGGTWNQIQKSAPIFVRGYARSLVDIARGVANGQITKSDGKMYEKNARLILVMGIANTAQVLFSAVQNLINAVINTLKTSINTRLPFPIL